MRIFIDTDVLLDLLLERHPYFESSSGVIDWAETHPGSASVSWHGLANLHYLSKDGALDFIRELLEFCEVPRTGSAQMQDALGLGLPDLEDAMQVAAAIVFGARMIVTRKLKDFSGSPIKAVSPAEIMPLLYR